MTTISDNTFAQIPKQLACYIGLNEAVLLQELHKLTEQEKGQIIQGSRWVRMTLEEWLDILPFFDRGQVDRALANLIADGLILSATFTGRSKWYTILYDAVNQITEPVDRLKTRRKQRKEAFSIHNTNAHNEQKDPNNGASAHYVQIEVSAHNEQNECSLCADTSAHNEQLQRTNKNHSKNPNLNARVREENQADPILPGPLATAILECCELDFSAVCAQTFLKQDFLGVIGFCTKKGLTVGDISDLRRYWDTQDYRSSNGTRPPSFKQFLELFVPWQNWIKAGRPAPAQPKGANNAITRHPAATAAPIKARQCVDLSTKRVYWIDGYGNEVPGPVM